MTKYKCDRCGKEKNTRNMSLFKNGLYCSKCRLAMSDSVIPMSLQSKDIENALNKERIVRSNGHGGVIHVPDWLVGSKVKIVLA